VHHVAVSENREDGIGRVLGIRLLHDRLVLEAKRKLSFSHQSVKEISYELGFEDPAYFSRFFKNHAGIAPQDFRDVMFK